MRKTLSISMHRLFLAGALFVGAGLFVSTGAEAAQPTTQEPREEITLSPTRKAHSLEPGERTTDSFKVINTGSLQFDFKVYTRPFSVKNRSYEQNFQDVTNRANAYAWVQFEQTEYSLDPGESAEVKYSVSVPENAIPGGQYGVLFAETIPQEESNESVVRKKRVGSILQVTVEGETVEQGRILEVTVPMLQSRPPLTTTTSVENTGTVDFDADLTLTAKDVFGNVKYSEKRDYTVYPDTIRDINFDWEGAHWFGVYNVEVASVVQDVEVIESQFVLIAPKWLLIVLVLGLLGGGYATFRRRK